MRVAGSAGGERFGTIRRLIRRPNRPERSSRPGARAGLPASCYAELLRGVVDLRLELPVLRRGVERVDRDDLLARVAVGVEVEVALDGRVLVVHVSQRG